MGGTEGGWSVGWIINCNVIDTNSNVPFVSFSIVAGSVKSSKSGKLRWKVDAGV